MDNYPEMWRHLLAWNKSNNGQKVRHTKKINRVRFMKEVDQIRREQVRQAQERYRQRKRDIGMVRVDLYVHQRHRHLFKRLEKLAEENKTRFTRKAVKQFCDEVENP